MLTCSPALVNNSCIRALLVLASYSCCFCLIAEEGPCARRLADTAGADTSSPLATSAAAAAAAGNGSNSKAGQQHQQQQQTSTADLGSRQQQPSKAASSATNGWKQQQQQQPGPKLAGRALNACWTCGVERNLRSKHCPFCK
jgi:hypothetical protein